MSSADRWDAFMEGRPQVVLTPIRECAICHRSTSDRTVVIEDVVTPICGPCWEQALDEAGPHGAPFENREGQPEFNGAFDKW